MSDAIPVLLDLDGTLLDNTYHHALAWQRAFAQCGFTIPFWRLHRTIGVGGDKLVARVAGEEVEERLGAQVRESWANRYADLEGEVAPLPGAADLVGDLVERGHRVAVASSGASRFTKNGIKKLGVESMLDLVTSSDDVDASKPEPDLIGTSMRKLGVESAVMVGDTPYDIQAAQAAHIPCVALLCGGFAQAELTDAGAATIRRDPCDLIGFDWSADVLS